MKKFLAAIAFVFGAVVFLPVLPAGAALDANFKIEVSSVLQAGFESSNLNDESPSTTWSSGWGDEYNTVCSEYIILDFREVKKIQDVRLLPAVDAAGAPVFFPSRFKFQHAVTKGKWTDIPDKSYSDYAPTGSDNQIFQLGTVARYVKIEITRRTADAGGIHLVRLAELAADTVAATSAEVDAAVAADEALPTPVTGLVGSASSYNVHPDMDFKSANLFDGNVNTAWCSEWMNTVSEDAYEWIKFAVPEGGAARFSGVTLWGVNANSDCFPVDFSLSYSFDDMNYFTIDNMDLKGYAPSARENIFTFETPVVARYIKVDMTKKSLNGDGNYIIMLGEAEVSAFECTEAEAAAAEQKFNELVGQIVPETPEIHDDLGLVLGLCIAGGVLTLALLAAWLFSANRDKKNQGESEE